jgi:hypothetical protein
LWYDTVDTLTQAVEADPDNSELKEDWINLLSTVGLPDYVLQENVVPLISNNLPTEDVETTTDPEEAMPVEEPIPDDQLDQPSP